MNIKLKVRNMILNESRGTVQFAEIENKKVVATITLVFTDPKQAAKFEHGREYAISISPSK